MVRWVTWKGIKGMELDLLRNIVKSGTFVVIDTETSALTGEPCQIGIVDQDGKVLLDTYVRPSVPIGQTAIAIHGITNDMVAAAPTFVDLRERLLELLVPSPVLSYNAVFDRQMLHNAADRWGVGKINWKTLAHWCCVMEAFAEWNGEWNDWHDSYRWKTLTYAAERAGIAIEGHHGALADSLIALGVARFLTQTHLRD